MGFTINKVIDLSKFGWDGCSVTFKSVSYEELTKFRDLQTSDPKMEDADRVVTFLESKFVSGQAKNETGKTVDLKATDIGQLPLEVFVHIEDQLIRTNPDPNF